VEASEGGGEGSYNVTLNSGEQAIDKNGRIKDSEEREGTTSNSKKKSFNREKA